MKGPSKLRRSGVCSLKLLAVLLTVPTSAFQPSRVGVLRQRWHIKQTQTNQLKCGRPRSYAHLYSIMADIESQAATAADTWSIEATPFMEPDVAAQVEEQFEDRADVIAYRVVGGRRLPTDS